MAEVLTVTPAANKAIPADPLLIAINAYRNGLTAYNAVEDEDLPDDAEDALFAAMVLGPDAVLTNWRSPASSHEAALAAISLAEREIKNFEESPVAAAMYAAAIGYWRNAGGSQLKGSATEDAQRVCLNDLSPDALVKAPDAAKYLKVSVTTLARWRSAKCGPVYAKIGGNVAYTVSALRDYVRKSERKGTRPDK